MWEKPYYEENKNAENSVIIMWILRMCMDTDSVITFWHLMCSVFVRFVYLKNRNCS